MSRPMSGRPKDERGAPPDTSFAADFIRTHDGSACARGQCSPVESSLVPADMNSAGSLDGRSCVLRVEGASKAFDGNQALDDVSFELRRGTIHALLGGNGSGKSTLIKLIAGVETADAGELEINGERHELRSMTPALAREAGLHFVHQQRRRSPSSRWPRTSRSAAASIPASAGGSSGAGRAAAPRAVLDRFRIDSASRPGAGELAQRPRRWSRSPARSRTKTMPTRGCCCWTSRRRRCRRPRSIAAAARPSHIRRGRPSDRLRDPPPRGGVRRRRRGHIAARRQARSRPSSRASLDHDTLVELMMGRDRRADRADAGRSPKAPSAPRPQSRAGPLAGRRHQRPQRRDRRHRGPARLRPLDFAQGALRPRPAGRRRRSRSTASHCRVGTPHDAMAAGVRLRLPRIAPRTPSSPSSRVEREPLGDRDSDYWHRRRAQPPPRGTRHAAACSSSS